MINSTTTARPVSNLVLNAFSLPEGMDAFSPESLIAFFEEKVKECRKSIGQLMTEQEARTKNAKAFDNLNAFLEAHPKGVKPDEPAFQEFQQLANDAISASGGMGSEDGQKIQAALDKALSVSGTHATATVTCNDFETFQKEHPDAKIESEAPGVRVYGYTDPTKHDPVGLDENSTNGLKGTLNAASTAIKSEASMTMTRVQAQVDLASQLTNGCSNLVRKADEMRMAAINNIK